jgi:hypothetical protein
MSEVLEGTPVNIDALKFISNKLCFLLSYYVMNLRDMFQTDSWRGQFVLGSENNNKYYSLFIYVPTQQSRDKLYSKQ